MPVYRTAASAYAIQLLGFGSTGAGVNTVDLVQGSGLLHGTTDRSLLPPPERIEATLTDPAISVPATAIVSFVEFETPDAPLKLDRVRLIVAPSQRIRRATIPVAFVSRGVKGGAAVPSELVRPALVLVGPRARARFAQRIQPNLFRRLLSERARAVVSWAELETPDAPPKTIRIRLITTPSQRIRQAVRPVAFVSRGIKGGAAAPSEPVKPARLVFGPQHRKRIAQRIQPNLFRRLLSQPARAVVSWAEFETPDSPGRTRPAMVVIANIRQRWTDRLQPLITKHVKDAVAAPETRTRPALVITTTNSRRRAGAMLRTRGANETPVATQTRTRPALLVAAPRHRVIPASIWLPKPVKDAPVVTGITRPVLRSFAPQPPHPWGQVIRTRGASPFSVPQTSFATDVYGVLVERPPLYAVITSERAGAIAIAMLTRPWLVAAAMIDRPAISTVSTGERPTIVSLTVIDRAGAASAVGIIRERLIVTGALAERAPLIVVALSGRPAIVALVAALRSDMISVSLMERPGPSVTMRERAAMVALITHERIPLTFVSAQER